MKTIIFITSLLIFSSCNFEQNNSSKKYFDEALKLYNAKEYEKSLILFNKAIKEDSNIAEPYFYIGMVYKKQDSTLRFSYNFFDKAITHGLTTAEAYYNRGRSSTMNGVFPIDFKKAVIDLDKAIELDSTYSPAYALRGDFRIAYFKDSLYEARREFELANPDKSVPLQLYQTPNEVYLKAIKDYDKSILYDQDNPNGYFNRAKLKEQIDDTTAHDDYLKAFELGYPR